MLQAATRGSADLGLCPNTGFDPVKADDHFRDSGLRTSLKTDSDISSNILFSGALPKGATVVLVYSPLNCSRDAGS